MEIIYKKNQHTFNKTIDKVNVREPMEIIRKEDQLMRFKKFEKVDVCGMYFHYGLNQVSVIHNTHDLTDNLNLYNQQGVYHKYTIIRKVNDIEYIHTAWTHKNNQQNPQMDPLGLASGFIAGVFLTILKKKCLNCKKPAHMHCSKCKYAYYCSRQCQVASHQNHKTGCYPPEIENFIPGCL